ncbi:DUF4364 family protein [Candidatus Soleaferrea massiliensis]|uniref:DUF4364 family protein n=1 Tax=Candidatus Soleaferrea massiliensis TaxID=1470354 RepID=UPI0018CE6ED5|nr:DUF4364 family protein [Candidatus Soleaferrea massiliensis]
MEQHAFTGGVIPGGLTTEYEIRFLICYLILKIGQPLSKKQMSEVFMKEGLVNYFEYAGALESLLKSGHIRVEKIIGFDEYYAVCDLGIETAKTFGDSLPLTVREKAVKSMHKLLTLKRREEENTVEIEQVENGYTITCAIPDNGADLMRVTLYVPDEESAQRIRRRFLNDPILAYKGVIAAMTGDTKAVGELVSTQLEDLFDEE